MLNKFTKKINFLSLREGQNLSRPLETSLQDWNIIKFLLKSKLKEIVITRY